MCQVTGPAAQFAVQCQHPNKIMYLQVLGVICGAVPLLSHTS
jgi:hypothetical protein